MKTLTRFRAELATLPHFVVLAAPTVPPDTGLKAQVRDILESPPDRIYRDGIESVDRAEIVDGAIEGEFSDRVGVRAVKRVGSNEVKVLNAIERATLQAAVKKRLSRDKKLFGTVGKSKAASDLSKAGNIIDVAESQKISKEAATVLYKFNTLKNLKGPLSDALNQHATELMNGGDRKRTEDELYKKVFEVLKNDSTP